MTLSMKFMALGFILLNVAGFCSDHGMIGLSRSLGLSAVFFGVGGYLGFLHDVRSKQEDKYKPKTANHGSSK